MKKKRIVFVIAISALSLIGLVILQINWILHAAQLRESQLRHRVTMASQWIQKRLSKDSATIQLLSDDIKHNAAQHLIVPIQEVEREKIARIIKSEFRYHHIDLKYDFDLVDKNHSDYQSSCQTSLNSHGLCLDHIFRPQRAELRIAILNKNKYIFAQMGWMLTASVILITFVIACFFLTIQTIWKQKRLSEMTSDFISNMTHELKTPISTVALASNMLRRGKIIENQNKILHYSEVIHDENRKLQEQVEQVLRIAKLEKGEFRLKKEEANIHEVILSAIQSIDLQVKSRNGQIRCYLDAIKHDIIADVNHLTNVICNLLDNANKYSPDTPEITVRTRSREDGVIISVEDKGIGMSKDKQKYIFDKFYRVPTGNIHNVKGFGLGLAYVKMMVDAHKGQIKLNSELGKGSRFDIFLPFRSA